MSVFVLVVLISLKAGPMSAVKIFPDRNSCQVAQGAIATTLDADKDVLGWSFPTECDATEVPRKV